MPPVFIKEQIPYFVLVFEKLLYADIIKGILLLLRSSLRSLLTGLVCIWVYSGQLNLILFMFQILLLVKELHKSVPGFIQIAMHTDFEDTEDYKIFELMSRVLTGIVFNQ